jgi:hypothetical protein
VLVFLCFPNYFWVYLFPYSFFHFDAKKDLFFALFSLNLNGKYIRLETKLSPGI